MLKDAMQRIFIGLAFIAFSFLFFWLVAGKPLGQWSEVVSWTEVPAKIMEVELMKHRNSTGGDTYECRARYNYTVGGRRYEGARVSLYEGSDNVSGFHHSICGELSEYRESGEPFRCFVNPDHPGEAVLYREVRWGMTVFVGLVALLFTGCGLLLIWGGVKGILAAAGDKFGIRKSGKRAKPKTNPQDDAYAAMFDEMFRSVKDAGENRPPDLPKRGGKKNGHRD